VNLGPDITAAEAMRECDAAFDELDSERLNARQQARVGTY
jgi:hypothetical protein